MKQNQRSNISATNQKPLRSKIIDKYKNHIQQLILDQDQSFDSIQTPGWTSLVNTEQSKVTNKTKNDKVNPNKDTHTQILNRLNSLPKLINNHDSYNNIRLNPNLIKDKNIIVYGSLKNQEKKKCQTPKSIKSQKQNPPQMRKLKSSNRVTPFSNNKQNSSANKFLNRFYSNTKPQIFYSLGKSIVSNLKSSRKRVSSVRSQPQENLKQRIKERLSMGNYQPTTTDFQKNPCTERNQITDRSSKQQPKVEQKFYSQIHAPITHKNKKNQYFNRYMDKLNQRTKQVTNVKVFKKKLTNEQNHLQTKPNSTKGKQNIASLNSNRFKAITVYDHLYQDHIKLESKKNVQKIIDDSYEKTHILTFTPFVSEKSCFLAESKFERQSIGESLGSIHDQCIQNCFKKGANSYKVGKHLKGGIFSIQEHMSLNQKEKIAEKAEEGTLSKLFSILSNNTLWIDYKSVQENIQKLPLAFIQLLQPLLTEVYKKRRFSEKEFLQQFSQSKQRQRQRQRQKENKLLSSKRQVIIVQTQKFLRSISLRQEKDKQNITNNQQQTSGLRLIL